MDLQAQIRSLIDDAPQDGITPQLITAIAPVLEAIAQKLRHTQYYILQDLESRWVLTTLSNRKTPEVQKHVIYAFPTLEDVSLHSSTGLDAQVTALQVPVTHILFQLIALEPVDSIIFLEIPGTTDNGVEIRRDELQQLIQQQLRQKPSQIPPDIA